MHPYPGTACGYYGLALTFERPSQAYEPDHAKAANSYPCFSHAGSDCDSFTIKANLPGALSERLMLQKWPRTEVHLSSFLQYSADPGLQALQNSPRPASPTNSAAYISPRNAAPLPPATAHARINPTLTCNCSRVLQMVLLSHPHARASHLITFNVRTPAQCPVLPYMPDHPPTPYGQLGFVNDLDQRCHSPG